MQVVLSCEQAGQTVPVPPKGELRCTDGFEDCSMGRSTSFSSCISGLLGAVKRGKQPFTHHGKARCLILPYCLARCLCSLTTVRYSDGGALPSLLRALAFYASTQGCTHLPCPFHNHMGSFPFGFCPHDRHLSTAPLLFECRLWQQGAAWTTQTPLHGAALFCYWRPCDISVASQAK